MQLINLLEIPSSASLALSDNVTIGLAAVQMFVNIALGLGLMALRNKATELQDSKREVREQATKIINEKFGGLRAEMHTQQDALSRMIAKIEQRLERGDHEFSVLGQRDQQQQLGLLQSVNELKEFVREKTASGADVRELTDRMHKMEIAFASFRERYTKTQEPPTPQNVER